MAVRLNIDELADDCGTERFGRAEAIVAGDGVVELAEEGGGAEATVRDGGGPLRVWVGLVDGELVGECPCAAADPLCEHAVAVVLAAEREHLHWSPAATPPSDLEFTEAEYRLAEVAAALPARQLVGLVARHAARDEAFAAELLSRAGLLDEDEPRR